MMSAVPQPEAARDREEGFTLVEVMIAILITGMLFLGFFSIIRNGINTQIMVREFSDAERAGPAVLNQLSEDLRNAYFYNIEANACFFGKSVDRGGNARMDQLHFLTTRTSVVSDELIGFDDDDIPPGSPLTEVSWMLRENRNGFYELVRREQPFCDDDQFKGGYLRLISDRIVSFKVQYTGWDFGEEEGEEGDAPSGDALAGALPGGNNPLGGDDEEEGDEGGLVWEDDWSAEEKGALPVAVKIELVISPDIDPAVMARMQHEERLGELERSYLQIVLLPQFRESSETMRRTYAWTGSIAEPEFAVGGGVAGGVGGAAGGGARGDARGGGAQGDRGRGAGGGRGGGGGNRGNPFGGGQGGGGGNPLSNILGGGGGGR